MFKKIAAGMLCFTMITVTGLSPVAAERYTADRYISDRSLEEDIAQEVRETESQLRKEDKAEYYGDSFSLKLDEKEDSPADSRENFNEFENMEISEEFTSGEIDFYQSAEAVFGDGEADLFTDSASGEPSVPWTPIEPDDSTETEEPSEPWVPIIPGAPEFPDIPADATEAVLDVVDGEDITGKLNSLLLFMKQRATDEKPCKVIIPPGNYQITGTICTYSNIHLYAVGAVITKTSPKKEVLLRLGYTAESAGGYEGYRNVTIEGGTWDSNYETIPDKEADGGFVGFRIGHVTNVVIKDVTFLNNLKSHFLEFGGVKNAKVTGCTFRGYWEPFTGGGQECIQIDVCKERIFPDYLPYDGAACEDIYIEGNTFENVFAGVGSHSMVFDRPYKNVVIRKNTFRDITKRAVWCLNYKDSIVEDNLMENVGGGVYVRSVYSGNTHLPLDGEVSNAGNQQPQNVTITNNNMVINAPKVIGDSLWRGFGVYVVGENVSGAPNGIPDGTYIVRGVNIRKNKISGTGNGVRLLLSENCSVSDNTINISPAEEFLNSGISMGASSSIKVTGNNVSGAKHAGIYLYRGPSEYARPSKNCLIAENTVTNCLNGGITAGKSSDSVKIEKNTVSNVTGNGISIISNAKASVKDNRASKCSAAGIMMSSCKNAALTGNYVFRNTGEGIRTDGINTKPVIEKNSSTKNEGDGILLGGGNDASLVGNNVATNKKNGISIMNSGSVTLSANKIVSNKEYALIGTDSSIKKLNANSMKKNGYYDVIYVTNTSLPYDIKNRAVVKTSQKSEKNS